MANQSIIKIKKEPKIANVNVGPLTKPLKGKEKNTRQAAHASNRFWLTKLMQDLKYKCGRNMIYFTTVTHKFRIICFSNAFETL